MTNAKTLQAYHSERLKLVYDRSGITASIITLQDIRNNMNIKIVKLDMEIERLEHDRR